MKAIILSIGDEILMGQTLNTNSQYLAGVLTDLGFDVREIITVPDSRTEIIDALERASGKFDLLLSTGGLGPTSDDITKQVLLDYFGGQMVMNEQVLSDVERFIKNRGRQMNQANRMQAMVPSSAKIVRNPIGTAPGLWFEKNNTVFVFMPGVPFEVEQLTEENLVPLLKEKFDLPVICKRFVHTLGIPEAELSEKLKDFETQLPKEVKLAYLPSPEDIKLRLTAVGKDREKLGELLDAQVEKITSILGDAVWGFGDDTLPMVLQRLADEYFLRIATAESCTSGKIAHMITSVPGSSRYFIGSIIAYANEVKENMLAVGGFTMQKEGVVSEPVVKQMALSAKMQFGVDFAVSTSGIAGPDGGSEEKPVGTTWIAVSGPEGTVAKKFMFGNRRDINVRRAAALALHMLINEIKKTYMQ